MYQGLTGRRNFLKTVLGMGALTFVDTAHAQPSAQGGSDLVRQVLGTYEGLRARGQLPSYQSEEIDTIPKKVYSITVDPNIKVGVLYRQGEIMINIMRTSLGNNRDHIDLLLDKSNSVTRLTEGYHDLEGDGKPYHNQQIALAKDGLNLVIGSGSDQHSIFIPGAKIPREYTDLARLVLQDLQAQKKR